MMTKKEKESLMASVLIGLAVCLFMLIGIAIYNLSVNERNMKDNVNVIETDETISIGLFKTHNVENISLRISRDLFNPELIRFKAYVEFKNGEYSGEREFSANSFDELVSKVNNFLINL